MDWSQVKSLTIPEGNVTKIMFGDTLLWKKITSNWTQDYTELEYIETTGTQRINPNLSGDSRWVITAQSTATSTSTLYVLLSSSSNASSATWYGIASGMWGFGNNNKSSISQDTKATSDLTFSSTGASGTVNGEDISRAATNAQGNWSLFRTVGGGDKFIGKFFEAYVYKNDVLVSHLIPVRRNSDNELGLYDTVRDVFFTNVGTGKFIAGEKVYPLPDDYTELEYIETTIGAYIDTGIMPSNDMIFETKIDFDVEKITDNYFSSLRNDTGNTRYYLLNLNFNYTFATCNTTWPGVTVLKSQVTAPYEIKSHIEQTKVTLQVNDVVKSLGSNLAVLPNHTLPLFAGFANIANNPTFNKLPFTVKCYYARYTDNGELVRDFIPAKNPDGVVGMYDQVSGEFFSSASANNFVAGPEIIKPWVQTEDYVDDGVTFSKEGTGLYCTDAQFDSMWKNSQDDSYFDSSYTVSSSFYSYPRFDFTNASTTAAGYKYLTIEFPRDLENIELDCVLFTKTRNTTPNFYIRAYDSEGNENGYILLSSIATTANRTYHVDNSKWQNIQNNLRTKKLVFEMNIVMGFTYQVGIFGLRIKENR